MTFDANVNYGGSSVVIRLITRLRRVRKDVTTEAPSLSTLTFYYAGL